MLNMNSLSMYFDGDTYIGDAKIAKFHANYNGRNSIHISINSDDIEAMRGNTENLFNDFKVFLEKVLDTADHEFELIIDPNAGE